MAGDLGGLRALETEVWSESSNCESRPRMSAEIEPPSKRIAEYGLAVTEVSDQLLDLHAIRDSERNARFGNMQNKITTLTDRVAAFQDSSIKKFEVSKDELMVFQDELANEIMKREELDRTKTAGIGQLDAELQLALASEQASLRETESKIMKVFEGKTNAIKEAMVRTDRGTAENLANLRRYLEIDVPKLYSSLREETKGREEMEKQMLSAAMEEVHELQGIIAAEKRAREDTEEVMLRMMEDAVAKMMSELAVERRERKQTEQMLFNLLSEVCNKLHVSSTSL
eukprot:TRINITY_DN58357_c0_g1_i1.p1 TRINITY_DN58357_c0_g1~~TRINITY_DN58357_c0_g1_i1.p1  ORF type:complete len:309 (-),score=53.37 TRINITY_DN58357_c0_g1_i1:89-943(-)